MDWVWDEDFGDKERGSDGVLRQHCRKWWWSGANVGNDVSEILSEEGGGMRR